MVGYFSCMHFSQPRTLIVFLPPTPTPPMVSHCCSPAPAPETVAFSSSSLDGKSGGSGSDFWTNELAWQRDELSKTFTVSVSPTNFHKAQPPCSFAGVYMLQSRQGVQLRDFT